MTQVFDAEGKVHPATILVAGPVTITQVKTVETDGYRAVQVGYGEKSAKNINKAQKGVFKEMGNFKYVKEFRVQDSDKTEYKVGDKIDLSAFKAGDTVVVSAISKGKGFQGVVKRHKFKGGPRSHGQKHSEREPGSISGGLRTTLRSGMRMAGRMGSDRTTVKNLKIEHIDTAGNYILVSGAVPGRRGSLVEVRG